MPRKAEPQWLISPSGELVEVTDPAAFCQEHGIDRGNYYRLINGERQHCKGWRSDVPAVGFTSKPYNIERYQQ